MRKILIVDDEEDVLELLAKRLISVGYEVIKAGSGQEGINRAKQELPNLIILDIFMPDIDGGEVARILREDEKTKNIPIIFLSCLYTEQDERKEGHLVGKNFFVAKPFDFHELLSLIDQNIR